MASISELSVAKTLTVYYHGIEKKFHYDGFEINSEKILKVYYRLIKVYYKLIISSLMRSLERFWKACNKI